MPAPIKHARPKRFPVLIKGRWMPLLIPFGVTQERAFVQVGERELRVCFGPLFDYRFPLEAVETAAPSPWPLWAALALNTPIPIPRTLAATIAPPRHQRLLRMPWLGGRLRRPTRRRE